MLGFDPSKDHLLDPQQRKESRLICGCCRRQIYYGEVYYTLITNVSEIDVCSDCHSEFERTACTAGEEIYA